MEVGASEIDITPEVGSELSGFAARLQPSTGVLDRLAAKALYLVQGDERMLWIECDLIGLPCDFVHAFRRWALETLDLEPRQVLLAATHTHSGPPTIMLHEAGMYDGEYLGSLREWLEDLAMTAVEETQRCRLTAVEGRCELAVDRRGKPSAHADHRVAAFGWRRPNGEFQAVLLNYAMHAVALGPGNRRISADWPGRCAEILSRELPGEPMVIVANGACGNVNPPAENIPPEQLDEWGGRIARSVTGLLAEAPLLPRSPLAIMSQTVVMPLEVLTLEQINEYAEQASRNAAGQREWGEKYRRAVARWRDDMSAAVVNGTAEEGVDVELWAARLGDGILVGVGAEVFSAFTDLVRSCTDLPVYTVGYANGLAGYVPTLAAYDEGGYEVDMAHLFYNSFRMQRGNLEYLADCAKELARDLAEG